MRNTFAYVAQTLVAGLLIIIPVYLAVLLLLKGMKAVGTLVKPFVNLFPESWPAESLLSLLFVLGICFLVGIAMRTRAGKAARQQMEKTFFERIPGYALVRSLTQQVAGQSKENVWKPALIDIDDGSFSMGFIIEEFPDGRYTVFVPSIPTPLAGAVFVMEHARVHPVDVPFTDALKLVSKWGSGARRLVDVMEGRV